MSIRNEATWKHQTTIAADFVRAVCASIAAVPWSPEQDIQATRLWNLIDRYPNGEHSRLWAIMTHLIPDCFDDERDANSIRFTYGDKEEAKLAAWSKRMESTPA